MFMPRRCLQTADRRSKSLPANLRRRSTNRAETAVLADSQNENAPWPGQARGLVSLAMVKRALPVVRRHGLLARGSEDAPAVGRVSCWQGEARSGGKRGKGRGRSYGIAPQPASVFGCWVTATGQRARCCTVPHPWRAASSPSTVRGGERSRGWGGRPRPCAPSGGQSALRYAATGQCPRS